MTYLRWLAYKDRMIYSEAEASVNIRYLLLFFQFFRAVYCKLEILPGVR